MLYSILLLYYYLYFYYTSASLAGREQSSSSLAFLLLFPDVTCRLQLLPGNKQPQVLIAIERQLVAACVFAVNTVHFHFIFTT